MKRLLLAVGLAVACVGDAYAGNGLDPSCAAYHALVKPTDTSIDRLWTRKGPDLWYAGSKFNADWLVAWLRIRKQSGPPDIPTSRPS